MTGEETRFWEFEGFRLESDEGGRLWKDGEEVHLKPKAAEVLRLLVEAGGSIVSRDEMLERVWPGTHVEEGNINYTISCLRKALREHGSDEIEYIRTVPKTGYRLMVPVTELIDGSGIPVEHISVDRDHASGSRARYVLLALVSVFLMSSFGIWWNLDRGHGISPVPVGDRNVRSLAVLPLTSLDESDEDEVLSVAVADSLASEIGKLNAVAVRPLSSALALAKQGKDELEIGKSLNADSVLAGTFLREGTRIRFNFRLLDSRDGAVIWTDKFDVPDSSVLSVQGTVTSLLKRDLPFFAGGPGDQKDGELTRSDEAYRNYLLGKYLLDTRTAFPLSGADYFRIAVDLDGNFAEAHLGLAESLAFLEPPQPEMEAAIDLAIRLAPESAEVWATHGFIRMFHHWDWDGARDSFERAVLLDPTDSKARHWKGVYHSLTGDLKAAKQEMKLALSLDPSSPFIRKDIAELYYYEGDLKEAEDRAMALHYLDPENAAAKALMVKIELARDNQEAAGKWWLERFKPDSSRRASLNTALSESGFQGLLRSEYAALQCHDVDVVPNMPCAEITFLKDGKAGALRYLERAAEVRMFMLPFVSVDPFWKELESDERFQEIVDLVVAKTDSDLRASND